MGLFDNIPIVKAKANRNSSLASYLHSKKISDDFLSSTANSVFQNNTVGEQRFALPDYGYPDLSKNRIIETPVSTDIQINPADMNGFKSTVTGAGNLNNGLWNNGVGAQNPLSVGYTPTQVDTVAKAPIGAGNTPTQSSTPSPMLYASNQAGNANGVPTIQNHTQETVNPYDLNSGMPDRINPDGYDMKTSEANARAFIPEGSSGGWSGLWDSVSDFSSKDAAKNSLGNIATGVNVAGGLFDSYTKYQSQKAQADYQNRIAGLYEKQYADTEARRAQAQANYDASVPK